MLNWILTETNCSFKTIYSILLGEGSKCENHCSLTGWFSTIYAFNLTLGEDTLTWTIMGANEVLMSCAGWLMVSASNTTSCRDLASSKILSISLWTSATKRQQRIAEQIWTRRNRKLITTPRRSAHHWLRQFLLLYQGWSGCWISQWWPSYWGCLVLTSWPTICQLLPLWWISWNNTKCNFNT